MPSKPFAIKYILCVWATAASLLLLTACGTVRTVPFSPPPPPAPPAIIKPLASMQALTPPPPPKALSQLPPEQQAQEAFIMYQGMAAFAGRCIGTRQNLIDWITQF